MSSSSSASCANPVFGEVETIGNGEEEQRAEIAFGNGAQDGDTETFEGEGVGETPGRCDGRLFLDESLPDLSGLSVAEIENIVNQLASQVTEEDILAQTQANEAEVEDMKEFMKSAERDGLFANDEEEAAAAAPEGSILLRDAAGGYNPIVDKYRKERGGTADGASPLSANAAAERSSKRYSSTSVRGIPPALFSPQENTPTGSSALPVGNAQKNAVAVIVVPFHTSIAGDEVLRYAATACSDSYRRGDYSFAPILAAAASVGAGTLTNEAIEYAETLAHNFSRTGARVLIYADFVDSTVLGVLRDCAARQCASDAADAVAAVEIRTIGDCSSENASATRNTASGTGSEQAASVENAAFVGNGKNELDGANEKVDERYDPMPDKSRINRFSTKEDGSLATNENEYPDGVAGYAADGTAIPIINAGENFNPRVPNTLQDMDYRNQIMSMGGYRGELDKFKPHKDHRWAIVSYMGPKQCRMKHTQYMMRIWGVARNETACARLAEHVLKTAFYGRLFDINVVPCGQWFPVAPPQFAKDATATYSNPLQREYMDSYIREQKRATVEMEQRVMDDEIQARANTNAMVKQLRERHMNPSLAPTSAELASDMNAHRSGDDRAIRLTSQPPAHAQTAGYNQGHTPQIGAAPRAAAQQRPPMRPSGNSAGPRTVAATGVPPAPVQRNSPMQTHAHPQKTASQQQRSANVSSSSSSSFLSAAPGSRVNGGTALNHLPNIDNSRQNPVLTNQRLARGSSV